MKNLIGPFAAFASLLAAAVAAPPSGFEGEGLFQARDYPGYCFANWYGRRVCHEASDSPWREPRRISSLAEILAPASDAAAAPKHVCAAILVAQDWALTAAHCVSGRGVVGKYSVGVGYTDLDTGRLDGDGAASLIEKVVLHPKARNGKINLALVRFRESAATHISNPTYSPDWGTETRFVQLVSPRPENARVPKEGARKIRFADIMSGERAPGEYAASTVLYRWSRVDAGPPLLIAAPLFALPDALCNRQLAARDRKVGDGVFCALSHERPICPEDAGAPAMGGYQSEAASGLIGRSAMQGDLILVAVSTWDKDRCAAPGEPGQFALVSAAVNWIDDTIAQSRNRRKQESIRVSDPQLYDRDPSAVDFD